MLEKIAFVAYAVNPETVVKRFSTSNIKQSCSGALVFMDKKLYISKNNARLEISDRSRGKGNFKKYNIYRTLKKFCISLQNNA